MGTARRSCRVATGIGDPNSPGLRYDDPGRPSRHQQNVIAITVQKTFNQEVSSRSLPYAG